jgi:hypothetical protein
MHTFFYNLRFIMDIVAFQNGYLHSNYSSSVWEVLVIKIQWMIRHSMNKAHDGGIDQNYRIRLRFVLCVLSCCSQIRQVHWISFDLHKY